MSAKVLSTGTMRDPRHVPNNRVAIKRTAFIKLCCKEWLKRNKPSIYEAIRDSAYKKFPLLTGSRLERKLDSVEDTLDSIAEEAQP